MRIAFLLFPNVTQLDLTGPAQVLSRLGGGARVDLVWKTLDPVVTDAGFAIVPTATFAEVPAADILCVPGGTGTNAAIADAEALDWVRRVGSEATWVTSVCTGSLILGAAGLLRGYRATSHWAQRDNLALFGAEPVAERVVQDRAVRLALEYDPHPPFDSGSPERAGAELVAAVRKRSAALAPERDSELRGLAHQLGFTADM